MLFNSFYTYYEYIVWYIKIIVCLIVPLENFSLIWRRYHYRWRAANFDLCSALMAIELCIRLKWWSPRTRDIHTYCRAFSSGAVTTCFNDLRPVADGIRTPNIPFAGPTLYPTAPPPRWIYNDVRTLSYLQWLQLCI